MINFFNIFNFKDDINIPLINKCKYLFYSILLSFIFVIISALIIITPLDYFIKNQLKYESVRELLHFNAVEIDKMPFYLSVLLIPFLEETLFRLILKTSKINLSIFLFLFLYIILGGKIIKFDFNLYYIQLLIALITSIIVYFSKINVYIISIIRNNIKKVIIISIVMFGLVHIDNINILHWQLAFFYPFFVLPQMISGYFITNIRLKYGFLWGLLMHSSINFIPFFVSYIIKHT